MRIELLKGTNGMCIALDSTRITEPKIYGMLTPIMVWVVSDERIRQILDSKRFGYWEDSPTGNQNFKYCSECGGAMYMEVGFEYCPHCGAKMEVI